MTWSPATTSTMAAGGLAQGDFDALIADVRLGPYNELHLITLAAPSMIRIAMSAFMDIVICRDAEQAGAQFVVKPGDCASVSALLPACASGNSASRLPATRTRAETHTAYP